MLRRYRNRRSIIIIIVIMLTADANIFTEALFIYFLLYFIVYAYDIYSMYEMSGNNNNSS